MGFGTVCTQIRVRMVSTLSSGRGTISIQDSGVLALGVSFEVDWDSIAWREMKTCISEVSTLVNESYHHHHSVGPSADCIIEAYRDQLKQN